MTTELSLEASKCVCTSQKEGNENPDSFRLKTPRNGSLYCRVRRLRR
jgi:hypothetical protein